VVQTPPFQKKLLKPNNKTPKPIVMNAAKQKIHFTDRILINFTNPILINVIGAGGTGSKRPP
jgi:hypothetical protein